MGKGGGKEQEQSLLHAVLQHCSLEATEVNLFPLVEKKNQNRGAIVCKVGFERF